MKSSLAFLDRARRLLAVGDPVSLRYACLELRFALEDHAYYVLRSTASRIPSAVLDKWQPPQAMKLLLEYEPKALSSHTVTITPEPVDSQAKSTLLGQYTALPLSRLNKLYNKLGSYLHLPEPGNTGPSARSLATPSHEGLLAIADEIQPALASTIIGSMAEVIQFACLKCDQLVVRNADSALEEKQATCLNRNCGAMHVLTFDTEGVPTAYLDATAFECLACNAPTTVENRHLKIGLTFQCSACKARQTFLERQWGYALTPSQ
jgi:hypothetical protein